MMQSCGTFRLPRALRRCGAVSLRPRVMRVHYLTLQSAGVP
jgi:hypothetical protein